SIVFSLERTNQLNLLPDKDLVDLCPPIEPYQVTKNQTKSPSGRKTSRRVRSLMQVLLLHRSILGERTMHID
ncbi:hypothetical protein, partial [Microcystis aeruginosa]|uniref:hypothetical protein n=1 Tax=Microcystis aeruginosa TaxID=1126 RepID=UPI0008FF9B35